MSSGEGSHTYGFVSNASKLATDSVKGPKHRKKSLNMVTVISPVLDGSKSEQIQAYSVQTQHVLEI